MSNYVERNKARIESITAYALSLTDNTETEIILKDALTELLAVAHGLNNALGILQTQAEEVCSHCEEELQNLLDKRGV